MLLLNRGQERDEDLHRLLERRQYADSDKNTERGRRSKLTYDI